MLEGMMVAVMILMMASSPSCNRGVFVAAIRVPEEGFPIHHHRPRQEQRPQQDSLSMYPLATVPLSSSFRGGGGTAAVSAASGRGILGRFGSRSSSSCSSSNKESPEKQKKKKKKNDKKQSTSFGNPIKRLTQINKNNKNQKRERGVISFTGSRGVMNSTGKTSGTSNNKGISTTTSSEILESLTKVWLNFVTIISKLFFQVIHYIKNDKIISPTIKQGKSVVAKYWIMACKFMFQQFHVLMKTLVQYWTGKLSLLNYCIITTSTIGLFVSLVTILLYLVPSNEGRGGGGGGGEVTNNVAAIIVLKPLLAWCCGCFFIPLIFIYQKQISKLQSYRTILNDMRLEVNQMSSTNTKLVMNNSKLQQTTNK